MIRTCDECGTELTVSNTTLYYGDEELTFSTIKEFIIEDSSTAMNVLNECDTCGERYANSVTVRDYE